jgi:selenocysteine-specific elongation factor
MWGQPFILRDVGGERTVAGGHVLQPNAKRMRRRQIDAIEHLERLRSDDSTLRWTSAVWFTGIEGVHAVDIPRIIGCRRPPEQADQVMLRPGSRDCWVHRDRWSDFEDRILKVTWRLHQEHPLLTTLESKRISHELGSLADPELTAIGIDGLLKQKRLTGDRQRVAHREFKPRLTAAQRAVKERIVAEIRAAEFQPPEIDDYASLVNNNSKILKEIMEVAAAEGSLQSVSRTLWLSSEYEKEMVRRVREQLKQRGSMTVSDIRDLLGTTRKYAVPYCVFLDRIGVTVRKGDFRTLAEEPPS